MENALTSQMKMVYQTEKHQSFEEAQYIDSYFLNKYKFDLIVDGDESAAEKIFNHITK